MKRKRAKTQKGIDNRITTEEMIKSCSPEAILSGMLGIKIRNMITKEGEEKYGNK